MVIAEDYLHKPALLKGELNFNRPKSLSRTFSKKSLFIKNKNHSMHIDCPNWFNESYMRESKVIEELLELRSMKSISSHISPKRA